MDMTAQEYALIQEKLNGMTTLMNSQFEAVHERLDKINGKVGKHEEQIQEVLIERAENRESQRQYAKILNDNCQEVSKMKHSLQEYNMIMKYPKLFIGTLFIVLIMTLATFIEKNDTIKGIFQKPKIEQVKTNPPE